MTPIIERLKEDSPFLRGIARLFDFRQIINQSENPQIFEDPYTQDKNALKSDWIIVGEDIKDAIKNVMETQQLEK